MSSYQGRQPDSYGRPRHVRGGGSGRGGGQGYHSRFSGINDFNAVGANAPAFRQTNRGRVTSVSRNKKRKYVKGGRIPKKKKSRIHEGKADEFYCEPCDTYFPCRTSWDTHKNSRKHDRRVREIAEENHILRAEEAAREAAEEEKDEDEQENRKKEEGRRAREARNKRTVRVMSREDEQKYGKAIETRPEARSLKEWATKSLARALRDDNTLNSMAVGREILYTYRHHDEMGSLLKTTWSAQKLADGKNYHNEAPEEVRAPKFFPALMSEAQDRAATPAAGMAPPPANSPASIATGSVNIPTATPTPVPNAIDVDNDIIDEPRLLLRKTKISWPISNVAQRLLQSHQTTSERRMDAIALFYQRYKNIAKKKPEVLANQRASQVDREQLQAKFNEYQTMEAEGDFETDKFIPILNDFIAKLEAQGGMKRVVREALFLIVKVALASGDIDQYHEEVCAALDKMMQQFQTMEYSADEMSGEFLAHWLVSLLFKRKNSPENNGYYLDLLLASIPKFLFKAEGMEYGLKLIKSVLHGNHVRFMNMLRIDPMHGETESRTEYILEPLQDFMRQRAWMLFGKTAPARGCKIFKTYIKLEDVMDQLNFYEIENNDDEDEDEDDDNSGAADTTTTTTTKKVWLRDEAVEHCNKAGLELGKVGEIDVLGGILDDNPVKLNPAIDVKAACAFLHYKNSEVLCAGRD